MKRFAYIAMIIFGIFAIVGTGISCKREMFDEEKYDTLIKIVSPVDTVDPNHTWTLTASKTFTVTVNAGVGTKKLQILDLNPMASSSAHVMAQIDAEEGDRVSLNVCYPLVRDVLFAAAVDADGKYTIASFKISGDEADFSNTLVLQQELLYTPSPQYHAFCYEQEFPEPGDYDYNDVVMHIALERASAKEMYVRVRLAAVGGDQQLAGCIRLPEFGYNEIDTVYTVNDDSFNKDITDQYLVVQKDLSLLLKGRSGEPILNLFADAHWATGDVLNADFGTFQRKKYNVTKQSDSKSQLMVPREIIFVIRSKNESRLNEMALDNIDPFIIKGYNGANMEVHTFPYRKVKALNDYNYIEVDNLPWALAIPTGAFCHPLDGVNMGFRLKGQNTQYLFGAYAKKGNSFGEWSMNHNSCLNWYEPEFATANQVFIW